MMSEIVIVEDGLGRLGPARSYSRLLERALDEGADWVALCDQDDWWLPQKLERLVERAEELDSEAPWFAPFRFVGGRPRSRTPASIPFREHGIAPRSRARTPGAAGSEFCYRMQCIRQSGIARGSTSGAGFVRDARLVARALCCC